MSILSLGKARESLGARAESYKQSVRRYLEAVGFAEVTDSAVEGHMIDMTFERVHAPRTPQLWVEAKDTDLSPSDPEFRSEMLNYFAAWAKLSPESRFELYVFARKLLSRRRWDRVFGEEISVDGVIDWLGADQGPPATDPGAESTFAVDPRLVTQFFSATQIIEADSSVLEWAAARRRESSPFSPSRWPETLKKEMDMRARTQHAPGYIALNLVPLRPPQTFLLVHVPASTYSDYQNLRSANRLPPSYFLSANRVLALDTEYSVEDFAQAGGEVIDRLSRAEVLSHYRDAFLGVLNRCIQALLHAKGTLVDDGARFFPPVFLGSKPVRRRIPSGNGRFVTVTKPFYEGEEPEDDEPTGDLSESATPPGARLNFVFHHGFYARATLLWDETFVSIVPLKIFTTNGFRRLDARDTQRLDAVFRTPKFSRNRSQLSRLWAIAWYLFADRKVWFYDVPEWSTKFAFGRPNAEVPGDLQRNPLLTLSAPALPQRPVSGLHPLEYFTDDARRPDHYDDED